MRSSGQVARTLGGQGKSITGSVCGLADGSGDVFALAGLAVFFILRAGAGGLIGYFASATIDGHLNLLPFRCDDAGASGSLLIGS